MKAKRLGIGDKCTMSGDPQDMGLNERTRGDYKQSPRTETNLMEQRPEIRKASISSDRGKFKCK